MDLLVERCAGLDVAKREVVACVRTPDPGAGGQRRQAIRTFATFSAELEALADWLEAEGVTQVVLEATGQYWKPIWWVLEARGFALLLVNARHVKILPGRKTDVGDAAWLCELLECGLLRGSFVPPPAIRQLRDLSRYRKRLIQAHSAECQRVQRPWRTPASSWTRSPLTSWASRAGPCWPPSSAGSATPRSWRSWPRASCARSSPSCARRCEAASATTTRC
jgi:hypothetical protein